MKQIKTSSFFFLAILGFLASCKSDASSGALAPPPPEAAPPASPKPEVYLYAVKFDKLNLRDQSSKNGKVITQFAEGDIVEGNGEVSANTEEATLRNIQYIEPYFKVTSTTPEQHTGWAYSAALTPIYAGPRNTSPDLGKIVTLTGFLKTLDVKKLDSGKKAIDYVSTNFANASGTLADAAYLLLQGFLFRMEIEGDYFALTEIVKWADVDYEAIWKDRFDMNKYPITKSLADNGFRLEVGEGMVYPTVDLAKLADFFREKATPPMKEYLLQNVAEQKDNAYDDGGIVIGLDTLAARAIFWEHFNKQNPYFVNLPETREQERWLNIVVLNGADNTPCYNSESLAITDEFKKNWALILQKYPGTNLAKNVKELSDLCAAEGWKHTKKVEDWQMNFVNSNTSGK